MNPYFSEHSHFVSACTTENNCVAVAIDRQLMMVGLRDTKDDSQQALVFTKEEWEAFIEAVKKQKKENVIYRPLLRARYKGNDCAITG